MDIVLNTLLGPSGLSAAGRSFFKCLDEYGLRVIPMWALYPDDDSNLVESGLSAKMIAASTKPIGDHVQFHVGTPHAVRFTKGRRLAIGSLVHENNTLVGDQITVAKTMDAIASPSYFCRNACLSAGIHSSKVHYIPYPLDLKIWHPLVKPNFPNESGNFRFLYMNTVNERKGLDVLLNAWNQEFSARDGVELVIKSYWQDTEESAEDFVLRHSKGVRGRAPISVVYELLHDDLLPGFIKSFDAIVSPHRAEGFGMNPWHAMAMGVPVIATDYSGTMDFVTRDTGWPVKVEKMSKGSSQWAQKFKYQSITWAEPSVEDLQKQMRECIKNGAARFQKADNGIALVSKKYCHSEVLHLFEEALESHVKGIWSEICRDKDFKVIIPSRFTSEDEPVELIEV